MPVRKAAAAALALIVPLCAEAQVYKCVENGQTVFTDKPCHADAKPLDVRPATGNPDPSRRAEAAMRTSRDAAQVRDIELREQQELQARQAQEVQARRREQKDKLDQETKAARCAELEQAVAEQYRVLRLGGRNREMKLYQEALSEKRSRFENECR